MPLHLCAIMRGTTDIPPFDLSSFAAQDRQHKAKLSFEQNYYLKDSMSEGISPYMLFAHYFEELPHIERMESIDCNQALPWLFEQLSSDIIDCVYEREEPRDTQALTYSTVSLAIRGGLLIALSFQHASVTFYFKSYPYNLVQRLQHKLHTLRKKKAYDDAKISFLVDTFGELATKRMHIADSTIDLALHYNDDFIPVDRRIKGRLQQHGDKGIVLLHGAPGTGKTSYIRHLIRSVDKEVIFIPVQMAPDLNGPKLLSFFIAHPNSIFVIEDAEDLVIDREVSGVSAVSALLNFTDGLLADSLGIQFVCTFNTDLSRVDKALLRQGRLIAQYEFRPLAIDKAQQLSDSLGFQAMISQPMPLVSIFHQNDQKQHSDKLQRCSLGFKIA